MRYRTKAEWAEAKAAEMEKSAFDTIQSAKDKPYSPSRWARSYAARDNLLSEAMRYRRMAARFAASGQ